MTLLALLQA